MIGAIAGVLLIVAFAVVFVWPRRHKPDVPAKVVRASAEPTLSFDDPAREELECENPLASVMAALLSSSIPMRGLHSCDIASCDGMCFRPFAAENSQNCGCTIAVAHLEMRRVNR
jgi:hypothetical protein